MKEGIHYDGRCAYIHFERRLDAVSFENLKIKGIHNMENAMAALAVSHCLMLDRKKTMEVMNAFEGHHHRMEVFLEKDGITFIDDSKATNVGAVLKALESLKGNVILILGGKDKGGSYAPLLPPMMKKVKLCVLIGSAAEKIERELATFTRFIKARDMDDAARIIFSNAVKNDTVLLSPACSSFDMFENYEERGREFQKSIMKAFGAR